MSSLLFCFCLAVVVITTWTYPSFRDRIPNGRRVPYPCDRTMVWHGVGHNNFSGSGPLNPFGRDFKAAGFKWTVNLCKKDSDGDGRTNGDELGDPKCKWVPKAKPMRTSGITHPGFKETECHLG